jgi:uncharacterized membrane-anchored protein
MKNATKTVTLTSILIMFILLGFGLAYNRGFDFKGLDLLIFALIVIFGAIALYVSYKRDLSIDAGFPADDEMTLLLKYKAGYYSFLISMYMWLFIFIFKDEFPDVETMLGGGILLSGLISFIVKFYIKRGFNA